MPYQQVSHYLRKALLDACALRALASDGAESRSSRAAKAAARLLRGLQEHLDQAQWNQAVDPQEYVGHCLEPLEPVGTISADSYHALAFTISDTIFQDIAYILSCAARDGARKGRVVRLYGDDGAISADLVTRHWGYVREYLLSGRCPDFAGKAEEIIVRMEFESVCSEAQAVASEGPEEDACGG